MKIELQASLHESFVFLNERLHQGITMADRIIVCFVAAVIVSYQPSDKTDTLSGKTESRKTRQVSMGDWSAANSYLSIISPGCYVRDSFSQKI